MAAQTVRVATAADKAGAIAVLTLVFSSDPAARWTWPNPKTYLAAFPRFVEAFGGAAFRRGSAHYIEGVAAALWLPPGVDSDEAAMVELMRTTADPGTASDGPQVMQQMARYHQREPHWYLPLLGVDPARQGQGLRGAGPPARPGLLPHAAHQGGVRCEPLRAPLSRGTAGEPTPNGSRWGQPQR